MIDKINNQNKIKAAEEKNTFGDSPAVSPIGEKIWFPPHLEEKVKTSNINKESFPKFGSSISPIQLFGLPTIDFKNNNNNLFGQIKFKS